MCTKGLTSEDAEIQWGTVGCVEGVDLCLSLRGVEPNRLLAQILLASVMGERFRLLASGVVLLCSFLLKAVPEGVERSLSLLIECQHSMEAADELPHLFSLRLCLRRCDQRNIYARLDQARHLPTSLASPGP
jgi:hypothetical protein